MILMHCMIIEYRYNCKNQCCGPEPVEPKLFGNLEPEPKINFLLTFSAVSLEDVRMNQKS